MVFRRYGLSLSVIGALFIALTGQSSAGAQQNADVISLSVSPPILEITANPGEKFTNVFKLTNSSDSAVLIESIPSNFNPVGEEGAVSLTDDDSTYAIAEWTTVEPSTKLLAARSSQEFKVTIDVPNNAEPGSHFGAIVFKSIPPENETAAALISQEIAPVVLVKLAGDITETAEITEFKSVKKWWTNQDSVELLSRIKNTGSAHFKPTGQLVIKNMFGKEVAKMELTKNNVLPDTIRQFKNEWKDFGFQVGRYTAELTVVSGDEDSITRASTSFYIFPYQEILPRAFAILAGAFLLYKGRKRLALAAKALSGKENSK